MREQPWIDTFFIFPHVKDSVVSVHGDRRSDALRRGLKLPAEAIPDAKAVQATVEKSPLSVAMR